MKQVQDHPWLDEKDYTTYRTNLDSFLAEKNFCQKPKKVQDLDAVVLEELSRL